MIVTQILIPESGLTEASLATLEILINAGLPLGWRLAVKRNLIIVGNAQKITNRTYVYQDSLVGLSGVVSYEAVVLDDLNNEITYDGYSINTPVIALINNFAITPLTGNAPLSVNIVNSSTLPYDNVRYEAISALGVDYVDSMSNGKLLLQGVYDVTQIISYSGTPDDSVTKLGYVNVTEPSYVDDEFIEILRDEFNGAVDTISNSHTPNVALSGVSILSGAPNWRLTGTGYIRTSLLTQVLKYEVPYVNSNAFDYRLKVHLSLGNISLSGALLYQLSLVAPIQAINNPNYLYTFSAILENNAGYLRFRSRITDESNADYDSVVTSTGILLEPGLVLEVNIQCTQAGITLSVNGTSVTLAMDASLFGYELKTLVLRQYKQEVYLNRVRLSYAGTPPPAMHWVAAFGPTHWDAPGGGSGFTWNGSAFVNPGPGPGVDQITAKTSGLLASAQKIRITYTNVGIAVPYITLPSGFQQAFPEELSDGTWTDTLWIYLPPDGIPVGSNIMMDPGESGLESVTISNIEVYVPV